MLDHKGFDLWAKDYDKSVGLSDESNTYPFAGYKQILGEIYTRIRESSAKKILDIGFGTATLTSRLYQDEIDVFGQDFSEEMIKIAQEKMPGAKLYAGDFTNDLVNPLKKQKYDAIVATYSLHHLYDQQKVSMIELLVSLLDAGGTLYIGDVAFQTRKNLEACQMQAGEEWDKEEFYFVYDELKEHFPRMTFEKYSDCAGLLTLRK